MRSDAGAYLRSRRSISRKPVTLPIACPCRCPAACRCSSRPTRMLGQPLLQCRVDARLPARTGRLEARKHVLGQPDADRNLGVLRARPAAADELPAFVVVGTLKHLLRPLGDFLVLLGGNDVRINPGQVARYSALFLAHWHTSSRSRGRPRAAESTPGSQCARAAAR